MLSEPPEIGIAPSSPNNGFINIDPFQSGVYFSSLIQGSSVLSSFLYMAKSEDEVFRVVFEYHCLVTFGAAHPEVTFL